MSLLAKMKLLLISTLTISQASSCIVFSLFEIHTDSLEVILHSKSGVLTP